MQFQPLKYVTMALLLSAMSAPAMAHGSMKPQHGGQVTMVGETVVELVITPKQVDVYASEEDEPLNAADFSGKLTITAKGKSQDVALKSLAGNRFSAAAKVASGAKVVVTLQSKDGMRTFATFTAK